MTRGSRSFVASPFVVAASCALAACGGASPKARTVDTAASSSASTRPVYSVASRPVPKLPDGVLWAVYAHRPSDFARALGVLHDSDDAVVERWSRELPEADRPSFRALAASLDLEAGAAMTMGGPRQFAAVFALRDGRPFEQALLAHHARPLGTSDVLGGAALYRLPDAVVGVRADRLFVADKRFTLETLAPFAGALLDAHAHEASGHQAMAIIDFHALFPKGLAMAPDASPESQAMMRAMSALVGAVAVGIDVHGETIFYDGALELPAMAQSLFDPASPSDADALLLAPRKNTTVLGHGPFLRGYLEMVVRNFGRGGGWSEPAKAAVNEALAHLEEGLDEPLVASARGLTTSDVASVTLRWPERDPARVNEAAPRLLRAYAAAIVSAIADGPTRAASEASLLGRIRATVPDAPARGESLLYPSSSTKGHDFEVTWARIARRGGEDLVLGLGTELHGSFATMLAPTPETTLAGLPLVVETIAAHHGRSVVAAYVDDTLAEGTFWGVVDRTKEGLSMEGGGPLRALGELLSEGRSPTASIDRAPRAAPWIAALGVEGVFAARTTDARGAAEPVASDPRPRRTVGDVASREEEPARAR